MIEKHSDYPFRARRRRRAFAASHIEPLTDFGRLKIPRLKESRRGAARRRECLEIESFRDFPPGNLGLHFAGTAKWARIPPSNSGRIRIGFLIARRYRLSFKRHRYLCLPPARAFVARLAKAIGKSGKGFWRKEERSTR